MGERIKTTYLKDIAYDVLKQKILECQYPPGSVLNITELVEEIGASRTPIQSAMVRLQEENFVTIIPKKGIIVRGITLREMLEVLELRLQLEPHLILHYGDMIDKTALKQFLDHSKSAQDIPTMLQLHAEFKEILYEACLNRRMQEILQNLEAQNQRNRNWRPDEQRVKKSCEENMATAKYIIQNDFHKAAQSIRKHLEAARKFAMKKYV